MENSLESISSKVRSTLECSNIAVEGLEDALQACCFHKPFEGLESEYLQKKSISFIGISGRFNY